MNATLRKSANEILKSLLAKCTEDNRLMFKKMYSHKDLNKDVNDVVDEMPDDKIDHAILQAENTISKMEAKNGK